MKRKKIVVYIALSLGLVHDSALAQFDSNLSLDDLNGQNGFTINGVAAGDKSGRSVSSAGDFNGDGIDDLIIGAVTADPNGNTNAGSSYVVFGREKPIFKNGFDRDIPPTDPIQDGGLEAGTPNPNWNESSTNFGTPIDCTVGDPYLGSCFAWFGGTNLAETGTIDQDLIIPNGIQNLTFWLKMGGTENTTTGSLEVKIDENTLFTVNQSQITQYTNFTEVSVNISAYANGQNHNLKFQGSINGGSPILNFFVDEIKMD